MQWLDPCGDGVCADDEACVETDGDCGECQEYRSVTFGFDGLDDCGQVNMLQEHLITGLAGELILRSGDYSNF